MTTASRPHFGNLKARAQALGLTITKVSDGSVTGCIEYVMHDPAKSGDHMRMVSLYGIRAQIEAIEAAKTEGINVKQWSDRGASMWFAEHGTDFRFGHHIEEAIAKVQSYLIAKGQAAEEKPQAEQPRANDEQHSPWDNINAERSFLKDPKAYAVELIEAMGSPAEALRALPEARETFRAGETFWQHVRATLKTKAVDLSYGAYMRGDLAWHEYDADLERIAKL